MAFFRVVSVLFVIAGLGACQTTQYQTNLVAPVVAHNEGDIAATANQAAALDISQGSFVDIKTYPFFTEGSFGRSYTKLSSPKALAIGYPKRCSTYSLADEFTVGKSIEQALIRCFRNVAKLENELNIDCSCRVAAVNSTILMSKNELIYRKNLPAIALVKDTSGRKEILGYTETSGRTGFWQDLKFFTQSGQKVCDGYYTLRPKALQGQAELNCFQGRIKGPGLFRIHGYREGQAYGTALVNAGENQLILVYGLPTEEFYKRRAEILGE